MVVRRQRSRSGLALALSLVCVAAAGPSTQETEPAPRMTWPQGWVEHKSSTPAVQQMALNASVDAGAMFNSYPIADFADGLTLDDWANKRIAFLKALPANKDAAFGDSRSERVADHDAVVIEVDNVVKQYKIHYEHIYFIENGYFCTLTFWSSPSRWKTAQPLIADLIRTIK